MSVEPSQGLDCSICYELIVDPVVGESLRQITAAMLMIADSEWQLLTL